jgi:hypothetical protein
MTCSLVGDTASSPLAVCPPDTMELPFGVEGEERTETGIADLTTDATPKFLPGSTEPLLDSCGCICISASTARESRDLRSETITDLLADVFKN